MRYNRHRLTASVGARIRVNQWPMGSPCSLIKPPGTVVPGRPYVLLQFFFFQRVISEVFRPIAAKFCVMLGSTFYFITSVQKFGGLSPKNFGGEKRANFGPISDPFPLWARIYLERMEISKIGKVFDWQRFLPRWAKKIGKLWSTINEDLCKKTVQFTNDHPNIWVPALKKIWGRKTC